MSAKGWTVCVRRRSIGEAVMGRPFRHEYTVHRFELAARFHAWWINWMGPGQDYEYATAFSNGSPS